MSQNTALLIKTGLSIFLAILLLTNCVGKTTTASSATSEPTTGMAQSVLEENIGKVTAEEFAPLIIGGRQYRGYLGNKVEYETMGLIALGFPGDPVNCTVDDIDKILIVNLWVDPEDPESRNSLENLGLLQNIKELTIKGQNLNKVDFSPISSLYNLEELEIEGNITRLPDMSNLQRLKTVLITKGALESLAGLGGAGIEGIHMARIIQY
jgi:hypothetical protein